MDEQYIKDVYESLGGQPVLGSYDNYYRLITTDDSYIKEVHSTFGKERLGSFENFNKLVKKKEESTDPMGPAAQPSASGSSERPSVSSGVEPDLSTEEDLAAFMAAADPTRQIEPSTFEPPVYDVDQRGYADEGFEERTSMDAFKHAAEGWLDLAFPNMRERSPQEALDYVSYAIKESSKTYERYNFGDTKPLVEKILAEAVKDSRKIAGEILPNYKQDEEYQRLMADFQAEIDEKYTGAEQQTIYKGVIEGERQQLEDQYLAEKFGEKSKDYRYKYYELIPEELRLDGDFMEALDDKIYYEARMSLNLNNDGRHNDQPALEHIMKSTRASFEEITTSFQYAGNYLYANAISDLEGENKAEYLKDKRSEYVDRQNYFNEQVISFEKGITSSVVAGDWGNAGLQFAGQLARTAPQIALTMTSAGLAGAFGRVAATVGSALSNGVYGGVNTYINIIDSPEWEGNESGAFGYALSSGLGEGVFGAVSAGIMGSAAKGVQATGKVSKSFKDVAKGFLRRRGIPFLQEGVEEFATEVALGYAEAAFKGEMADTGKIFENALDSFLVGGAVGVGFSYIGSAQAATQSPFDASIGKKAAALEANLIDLNEALKNESDPEKRTNIENTIADTELELEKLKQSRIPFYDMMSVRHADDFKTIQQLDLDISRSVARMKKLPEGKSREVMKQRLEALIEQRNKIEKKHAGESLELTADEKSMMFDGRVQEGIDNLVEERSDAQDSRDAVEQSGTLSAIQTADQRLIDADSKLNEAKRLAAELETARKNLEEKQKSKDEEGFDDSSERQAVKDAERSLAQALKIKAPDADTDVKTDVTEEAPADPEPSKPLDQQIDDKVSKADAGRGPKKSKRREPRMRGFLKRTLDLFDSETRQKILDNPNSYFNPQKMKEAQKEFSEMTDAELIEMMTDDGLSRLPESQTDKKGNEDPLSILALIERVRRAHERGDSQAVADLMEKGGFLTTNAARIMRYAQELKKYTPDFLFDTLRLQIVEDGAKITPAQEAKLKRLVDNWEKRKQPYIDARNKAAEDGTKQSELELRKRDLEFRKAKRDLDVFMNIMMPDRWGGISRTTIQGNLLVVKSHVVNLASNMLRVLGFVTYDPLTFGINKLATAMGIKEKNPRSYSLGAYLDAVRFGIPRSFRDIAADIRGIEPDANSEWKMSRGLAPIRALIALASRSDIPVYDSKRRTINTYLKLAFQATFGVPAAINFKGLTAGDLPFRYMGETLALSQMGRAKGLKGDALKQFIKFPPKEALQEAQAEGARVTFQEPTFLGDTVSGLINAGALAFGQNLSKVIPKKIFDGEEFVKTIIRGLNLQYVKTPAAILTEALTFTVPVFGVARGLTAMGKGDSFKGSQHIAKAITGFCMIEAAHLLLKEGLMVGEVEDWQEDEAEENLRRNTFQENSINLSGLQRYLKGEDHSYRDGDFTFQFYRFGVIGQVFAATAKSTNKQELMNAEEAPLAGKMLGAALGLGPSTAGSMLDQTFMQGSKNLIKAMATDNDDTREDNVAKWLGGMFSAGASVVLPNQLATLTKYDAEVYKDKGVDTDASWSTQAIQLFNYTIKERTFNLDGAVPRIDIKGNDKLLRSEQFDNPAISYFFDPSTARSGSGDPYDVELYRLFEATGIAHDVLTFPRMTQNVKLNIPSRPTERVKSQAVKNTGKAYTFFNEFKTEERPTARLTPEQRENVTRALNKTRYNDVLRLFETEEYKSATDNEKLKMLTQLNEKYTSSISVDQAGNLMPHSVALLDAMQELYERELEDTETPEEVGAVPESNEESPSSPREPRTIIAPKL